MKSERIRSLIMLCALVISVQFGIALWVINYFTDWSTRGQFGDLFGVVNALFSGLAFAVLIYTMNLQRKELALQRQELALTREELSRSASAQEKSEAALSAQAELQLQTRS